MPETRNRQILLKNRILHLLRFLLIDRPGNPASQGTVILFSFLFALLLWFIVTLSQVYTLPVSVPVRISRVPQHIQLTEDENPSISYTLSGSGIDLLLDKLSRNTDTIFIPFDALDELGELKIATLANEIDFPAPQSLKVSNFQSQNLKIGFAEKVVKKVPLISRIRLKPAPSYQFSEEYRLEPDSVFITGVQSTLDTIDYWPTVSLEYPQLIASDQTLTVRVLDTASDLSVSPLKTDLQVSVERFTQMTLTLKPLLKDLPEDVEIILNPPLVKVDVLVPMKQYDDVEDKEYEWEIDYKELDFEVPFILPDLSGLPPIVRPVRIVPGQISYIAINKSSI